MRSTALPLTAFKIAVRGGCATLAGLQTIGVHGQTHRASWFAPLEAGLNKYLVKTFLFGLQLDQARARHHHGLLDRRSYAVAARHHRSREQVYNASIDGKRKRLTCRH